MTQNKKYKKSLFIFHRDLRLEDNTGLIEALGQSEVVIPAFIFAKKQIDENAYKSEFALNFMIESLEELNESLKEKKSQLYFFYGKTDEEVEKIIKSEEIEAVFSNRDYTPFAIGRDERLLEVCKKHQVALKIYDDALLTTPESVHKDDGKPYTVFTPFFKKAQQQSIKAPQKNKFKNYYHQKVKGANAALTKEIRPDLKGQPAIQPGRKAGLKLVSKIKKLSHYQQTRNVPALEEGTSHLSPHHKFGTVSIREVFHATLASLGPESTFVTELFWRDFLTHIAFHFSHVFRGAFKPKYDQIKWSEDRENFKKWCEGQTGFPIVDAGMRQLNQTGFMHNRVRMIVASFLVKDLHINWQWGEKYFAQKLIDYDPAVNNGNWQWAASTGCDAQPYFRIFNPWRQQERFDPEAIYIKKWVPELTSIEPKILHKIQEKSIKIEGYFQPTIDHKEAAQKAKLMFKGR